MNRLKRLIAQWLTIFSCCFIILYAAHHIFISHRTVNIYSQETKNNLWDPINNDANKAQNDVTENTEKAIEPTITEPAVTEPAPIMPAPIIPASITPIPMMPAPTEPAPMGAAEREAVAQEPVINDPKTTQKSITGISCPDLNVVNDNLYKGRRENEQGISFWVDFVTRPMYENDKITDLELVLSINQQITCQYLVNESDKVTLFLKANHKNGLIPSGDNWKDCNSFECEKQCIPDDNSCLFEIKD